jgi:hypothetical protein
MAISVVGVDLSKSVFQLSVADGKHHVIDRKRLSRAQFHRFLAQSTPARLVTTVEYVRSVGCNWSFYPRPAPSCTTSGKPFSNREGG